MHSLVSLSPRRKVGTMPGFVRCIAANPSIFPYFFCFLSLNTEICIYRSFSVFLKIRLNNFIRSFFSPSLIVLDPTRTTVRLHSVVTSVCTQLISRMLCQTPFEVDITICPSDSLINRQQSPRGNTGKNRSCNFCANWPATQLLPKYMA